MEQVSIVVGELMQGKEFAKKLFEHLNSSSSPSPSSSSSSSSHESNEALIEKILSTYEKALTMLNNTNIMKDSSHFSSSSLANGSTKSEVLDKEVVAPKNKQVSKKRKTMSMWTKQVKVCLGAEIDGSMEDGHSWRKYGQKDILGAKFPRGYYRCTHRHVQGCLATKQVQKSDEDPNVLEITYKGRHTCIHQVNNHLSKRVSTTTNSKPNMPLLSLDNHHPQQEEIKTEPPHETILTFGSSPSSSSSQELEVKIDEFDFYFDLDTKENIFSSFHFTSPTIISEIESFSPEFISPTTNSKSNNIFRFESNNDGLGLCVQTSDSDFSDNVSAPTTSVSNSPIIAGLDFHSFDDKVDFDNYFSMNS